MAKNKENVDEVAGQEKVIESVSIPMADYKRLMETLEDQSKKIEVLFGAADKARLAKVQQDGRGEPLIKTVKVSKWMDNGKLVLGWKLIKNISEIVNGRWVEDQRTEMVFEDGSKEEASLLDFYRKAEKVQAEIVGRNTKEDMLGRPVQILKVRFSDGKTLDIDARYIN